MPKILMFSPFFPPRVGAENIVAGKLALAFMDKGWGVKVVTSEATGVDRSALWDDLEPFVYEVPLVKRNVLLFIRLAAVLHTRYPIRGASWAYLAVNRAYELLANETFNVIMTRCHPTEAHLSGLVLKQRAQLPWIACWNDPTPPARSPKPYGGGINAPIGFWLDRYMREIIDGADWHVFPSEDMMEYMMKAYPGFVGKSSPIPHISLSALSNTMKFDCSGTFRLCHSGSMGAPRDPTPFFKGLSLFLSHVIDKTTVRLLIMGVPEKRMAEIEVPPDILDLIEYVERCSYQESLHLMSRSTVLVVLEPPLEESIYLLTKFVDSVQCGRPVLNVAPRGHGARLIERYGGGITADCTSPEAIASAIGKLYDAWQKGSIDTYTSAELTDVFSERVVLHQYEDIFKRIGVKQF